MKLTGIHADEERAEVSERLGHGARHDRCVRAAKLERASFDHHAAHSPEKRLDLATCGASPGHLGHGLSLPEIRDAGQV